MKFLLLFVLVIYFSFPCKAQNYLVLWSEEGKKFTLFADGEQVNDSVQSEVKTGRLYDDSCKIKVRFSDHAIAPLEATVFLLEKGKSVSGRDFSYSVYSDKGRMKMRFNSVNYSCIDSGRQCASPEKQINEVFISLKQQQAEKDKLDGKYPAPKPCILVIPDSVFNAKLQLFKNNHIENTRVKDVKWFISTVCISTKRLGKLLDVFDYEPTKERLCEFAYDYLSDKENFLSVLEQLKYSTEKKTLEDFYRKKTITK